MPRKPKFRPVITRVKLNPEQAVLSCNCFRDGQMFAAGAFKDIQFASRFSCAGKSGVVRTECVVGPYDPRGVTDGVNMEAGSASS